MGNDDDNTGRTVAVVAVLMMVVGAGGLIYFLGGQNGDNDPVPQQVVEAAAVPDPAPVEYREPDPEISPPAEPEPEPQVDPVYCTFPGDGFIQSPHGFIPTEQYVEFEPPVYLAGYNGGILPVRQEAGLPQDLDVCVSVLYDVSANGQPINISVLDVQPDGAAEAYYSAVASEQIRDTRYVPGMRNGKPVRIDNNFLEVRFKADRP